METVKYTCCALYTTLIYVGLYASRNHSTPFASPLLCILLKFSVVQSTPKCSALRYIFDG
jgi:hypothetical protein